MIDFRDACFGQVLELARKDRNVMLLTNDMGAMGLDALRKELPDQVVNVGIAEQNMISVAAGLAMAGKRVFVYGIVSHLIQRPYEQIKLDICTMKLPVTLLGVGAGLSYGTDGPTHHATHDISLMSTIPNMTIYSPSDAKIARLAVEASYQDRSPSYIRLDKEPAADLGGGNFDFKLGMRPITESDSGMVVVSTGIWVPILEKIFQEAGDKPFTLIDCYRIKPFNNARLTTLVKEARALAVIEEQAGMGSLGSWVLEWANVSGFKGAIRRLGLRDEFFLGAASRRWVQDQNGLNRDAVIRSLKELASMDFVLDGNVT